VLHLKGLRVYIVIETKLSFAKSQGFGSFAGMRIGRRKSGVKSPHSKMSAQGRPRAGGLRSELQAGITMPEIKKAAEKLPH
jgi:hypothetical protein